MSDSNQPSLPDDDDIDPRRMAVYRDLFRNTIEGLLSANFPVIDALTINAHVGYTRFASDIRNNIADTNGGTVPNYYDYKLGVTYDLSKIAGSGVSIAGAIVGASKPEQLDQSLPAVLAYYARFLTAISPSEMTTFMAVLKKIKSNVKTFDARDIHDRA